MKYLLIFFIIVVLVFQWRSSRADIKLKAKVKVKPGSANTNSPSGPQSMVACAQCGVHIPTGDAIQGSAGAYCSVAHRQLQES